MLSSRLGHDANTDCAPVQTGRGRFFLSDQRADSPYALPAAKISGIPWCRAELDSPVGSVKSIANCAPLD